MMRKRVPIVIPRIINRMPDLPIAISSILEVDLRPMLLGTKKDFQKKLTPEQMTHVGDVVRKLYQQAFPLYPDVQMPLSEMGTWLHKPAPLVGKLAYFYLYLRYILDKRSPDTATETQRILPLLHEKEQVKDIAEIKLLRFHARCKLMASAYLENTDPDPTFDPANELLALWDTKGVIKDETHRLRTLIDAFTAVVTTGAPIEKIVAYWDVLLNSKLGPQIANVAKHAIPNGRMVDAQSDVGLKIVVALFPLDTFASLDFALDPDQTIDLPLYKKRNAVLRRLIVLGFQHTWISEALLAAHFTLFSRDAGLTKQQLQEVKQDIQLLRSQQVETSFCLFMGEVLCKGHILRHYTPEALVALDQQRPMLSFIHRPSNVQPSELARLCSGISRANSVVNSYLVLAALSLEDNRLDMFKTCMSLVMREHNVNHIPLSPTFYETMLLGYFQQKEFVAVMGMFAQDPALRTFSPDLEAVYQNVSARFVHFFREYQQSVDGVDVQGPQSLCWEFAPVASKKDPFSWAAVTLSCGELSLRVTNDMLTPAAKKSEEKGLPVAHANLHISTHLPSPCVFLPDIAPPIIPPPTEVIALRTGPKIKTRPVAVSESQAKEGDTPGQLVSEPVTTSSAEPSELRLRNLKRRTLLNWVQDKPSFLRYEDGGRHPIAVFSGATGEYRVPLVNAHSQSVPIGTARSIVDQISALGLG